MISQLKGRLISKGDSKVLIEVGDFTYEVFTPKTVWLRLEEYIADDKLNLVIYHYLHSDQNKLYPVLIGFLSDLEKEFFERITKVVGIGPKAALKALDRPICEIAEAIDRGDVNYLKNLPGIGLQRAKNIVALLGGKMGKFTLIKDKIERKEPDSKDIHKEILEEAEKVLLQLQYKKREARDMVEKAFKANPQIENLEDLLNQIYKQKV
ncbi:MAG: Holliday junction DNA helicase RuvA [Candidatus Omnitrophica bacterium]|nr:Holliday junction DNA helicase RuvA [Candidatus Omnitrophota bacterium]